MAEDTTVRRNADGTTTTTTTRYDGDTTTVVPRRRSGGNPLLWIILILAVCIGIAYALGLFTVGTSGTLQAPTVSVNGGEVPKVAVDTGKVVVGTKKETIDVPVMGVQKADKATADEKAANK